MSSSVQTAKKQGQRRRKREAAHDLIDEFDLVSENGQLVENYWPLQLFGQQNIKRLRSVMGPAMKHFKVSPNTYPIIIAELVDLMRRALYVACEMSQLRRPRDSDGNLKPRMDKRDKEITTIVVEIRDIKDALDFDELSCSEKLERATTAVALRRKVTEDRPILMKRIFSRKRKHTTTTVQQKKKKGQATRNVPDGGRAPPPQQQTTQTQQKKKKGQATQNVPDGGKSPPPQQQTTQTQQNNDANGPAVQHEGVRDPYKRRRANSITLEDGLVMDTISDNDVQMDKVLTAVHKAMTTAEDEMKGMNAQKDTLDTTQHKDAVRKLMGISSKVQDPWGVFTKFKGSVDLKLLTLDWRKDIATLNKQHKALLRTKAKTLENLNNRLEEEGQQRAVTPPLVTATQPLATSPPSVPLTVDGEKKDMTWYARELNVVHAMGKNAITAFANANDRKKEEALDKAFQDNMAEMRKLIEEARPVFQRYKDTSGNDLLEPHENDVLQLTTGMLKAVHAKNQKELKEKVANALEKYRASSKEHRASARQDVKTELDKMVETLNAMGSVLSEQERIAYEQQIESLRKQEGILTQAFDATQKLEMLRTQVDQVQQTQAVIDNANGRVPGTSTVAEGLNRDVAQLSEMMAKAKKRTPQYKQLHDGLTKPVSEGEQRARRGKSKPQE